MAPSELQAKLTTLTASRAKEWDFYGSSLGPNDCRAVADALHGNLFVQVLNLEGNALGPEGAKALAKSLVANRHVHTLYLGMNSIRDEGAVALAECLSVNNTLQTISLGVNGIRDAGARALLEALKQNNAVRTLWLHGNPIADRKLLASVEAVLHTRQEERGARCHDEKVTLPPEPLNADLQMQLVDLHRQLRSLRAEHHAAMAAAEADHLRALAAANQQIGDLRAQLAVCTGSRSLPSPPTAPTTPPRPPVRVPWAEVETLLAGAPVVGVGGFGSVHRCEWRGEAVAMKRLAATSPQGLPQFLQELQVLALVRHPNVVELRAFAQDAGQLALAYPHTELGSLRHHVASRSFPWGARLQCAVGLAHGLQHLHSVGVLHRDLKPSNVLLYGHFRPRIADFGVSRLCPELLAGTPFVVDRVVGTKGYLAPEVTKGGRYSFQSDVYSLGVMLTQLFLAAECTWDAARGCLDLRPAAAGALDPPFPEAVTRRLAALVEQCTAPASAARGGLSSVAQALGSLLEECGPRECVVCMDHGREVRLPCKHKVLCTGCARSLPDCPLCRKPFQSFALDEAAATFV